MPAAQSKSDLLDTTHVEFNKLRATIARIEDNQATVKDEDDTSIKDVVAHRAHWVELYLGWYRDGQANRDVYFPARGYKWNQLKAYNRELRNAQSDLSWPDAIALLDSTHQKLLDLITSMSDAELYGAPMKGAHNDWTAGRWAEASGSSHYRSAAKYIRKRLKAL